MDPTTTVKRRPEDVETLHNPHFKPLWEPDTTVGGNAITYSLIHHVYQEQISTAGMCTFCTDELSRRVSEAARRLKSQGLFHDDEAFMDLFWQETSGAGDGQGGDGPLVAGETIFVHARNRRRMAVAGETVIVRAKKSFKMSVADHATELANGMPPDWWLESRSGFQGELAAMDRAEAVESQGGESWMDRLSRRLDGGRGEEATPWETRFMGLFKLLRRRNMNLKKSMMAIVAWREKYLNFSHDNCQCRDIVRLRAGVSFETVLMEGVLKRISPEIWKVIPMPPEEIWRNKARFLAYFGDQSSGTRNAGSFWDYPYSIGEVNVDKTYAVPGPLPRGWQRRCQYANSVCHYNSDGRLLSQESSHSRPTDVPRAFQVYTDDEENLIEP